MRSSRPAARLRWLAPALALRGTDRETAPSRADLEHVILRCQFELAADAIELRELRLVQRRAGPFEEGTRVGHRLIQHQAEEIVADVVVSGDPATRAVGRVRS